MGERLLIWRSNINSKLYILKLKLKIWWADTMFRFWDRICRICIKAGRHAVKKEKKFAYPRL